MQYRKMGKTGVDVSVLGFGMMRLPMTNGSQTSGFIGACDIDAEKSIENLRYAIDHGVNYVDTAYLYQAGMSEKITGLALKDGYRGKVSLATKTPPRNFKSRDDFRRILDIQLERLGTDYIDFYLLHNLNKGVWAEQVREFEVLKEMEKLKEEGIVRHIGFSFHDDVETFKKILDEYPNWEFCQIQLNYLDVNYQAGVEGLEYAAARGLGVAIMEPLRGGYLARVPEVSGKRFAEIGKDPVRAALEFVMNRPEVSVVLSGMNTMESVIANMETASESYPGMLKESDMAVYDAVRADFEAGYTVPCTACAYCMPCPQGVSIPDNFRMFNVYASGNATEAKVEYNRTFPKEQRADKCIACRACEALCPQHIKISEWMPKVAFSLG